MKRRAILYTAVTAALGAAGAVLHHRQLATVIDPETGLAARYAPVSVALAALSVLALAVFLGFVLSLRGAAAEPVYHKALAARTPVPLVLSVLLCAAMVYAAVLVWRFGAGARSEGLLSQLLALFALLAGVAWLVLCLASTRHKSGSETALASFVLILFVCFWLIISYKENATDPAMVRYVYDFLGLCLAAVGIYYLAGYAFGRSRVRASLFFSMAGAYFCLVALPQAASRAFLCFYAFVSAVLLTSVFLLTQNLRRAAPQPQEVDTAGEPDAEIPPEEPAPEDAPEDMPEDMPEPEDAPEDMPGPEGAPGAFDLEQILAEYGHGDAPDKDE